MHGFGVFDDDISARPKFDPAGKCLGHRGVYTDCKDPGTYRCVCCDAELFRSDDKFDSGSGWPSFTRAMERDRVATREDDSLGVRRIEILCARCDAHLGHVFPDGPREAGGMRYCVNSASLKLEQRTGEE